jgi:NADPH:quinone reductase-like Zn-dependent oxidoreductase
MHVAAAPSDSEPLRLIELAPLKLGPRDVRVRVKAIGVNPVDWKMRTGGPIRLAHRLLGPSGPLVVGIDFAGEVFEAGAKADLKVGARVVGGADFSRGQHGSYADELVVRDEQCAILPDNVSFTDAACVPIPGSTAQRAFDVGRLATVKNPKVLVLGAAGGVGQVTLQLARNLGGSTAGVCSGRNVALVEQLGAKALDYTKGDPLEAARAHGPYDLIVNAVGTATYALSKLKSLLAPTGRIALVVVRPADWPSMIFTGRVKAVLGRPNRSTLQPLVEAMARGALKVPIEKQFPLAEAEQAHELSRGGKVIGKLLLIP